MATWTWYWHRMRAMGLREMGRHLQRKWYQWGDRRYRVEDQAECLQAGSAVPMLPRPEQAPEDLRQALRRDMELLLAGAWKAFGRLPIRVDDPPRWHRDYWAAVDLEGNGVAFHLDHRQLPGGADIKLVWELSRWTGLTRLAMAAYVLDEERAGRKCLEWLEDWVKCNPPYRGWNWTSALEAGMRLIQWTWIDALLRGSRIGVKGEWIGRLENLGRAIVPAHVRYVWRYRSFGSSANNHLLGELAGLVLAVLRWPEVEDLGVTLETLQRKWEREVLAQFAADGGNREQALQYHLFTFELSWQVVLALSACRREVSDLVIQRLGRAADFFSTVQVAQDPWDYGDSDQAMAVWMTKSEASAAVEWQAWLNDPGSSPALEYWLGRGPGPVIPAACMRSGGEWLVYGESGIAVCWDGEWVLRWDLSPLGYLSTAAHGHLDALHVSLWRKGVAMVVDPGTGAYYADRELRRYLASWQAHNGPHPVGLEVPKRLGPFLWSGPHARPGWCEAPGGGLEGWLDLPKGRARRVVTRLEGGNGWRVDDEYVARASGDAGTFEVCWQFGPGARLERVSDRRFRLERMGVVIEVGLDAAWRTVEVLGTGDGDERSVGPGVCSPGFRERARGPMIRLRAQGHNPCLFRTTFLACADS